MTSDYRQSFWQAKRQLCTTKLQKKQQKPEALRYDEAPTRRRTRLPCDVAQFRAASRGPDAADQLLGPACRVELTNHLTQNARPTERCVDTIIADRPTNAEHQSYLGTHRNDGSRHETRYTAVFTDALRYFGGAAYRTAEHQATVLAVLRALEYAAVPVAVSSRHVGRSTGTGHLPRYHGRRRVRHRARLLYYCSTAKVRVETLT